MFMLIEVYCSKFYGGEFMWSILFHDDDFKPFRLSLYFFSPFMKSSRRIYEKVCITFIIMDTSFYYCLDKSNNIV